MCWIIEEDYLQKPRTQTLSLYTVEVKKNLQPPQFSMWYLKTHTNMCRHLLAGRLDSNYKSHNFDGELLIFCCCKPTTLQLEVSLLWQVSELFKCPLEKHQLLYYSNHSSEQYLLFFTVISIQLWVTSPFANIAHPALKVWINM